MTLVEIFAQPIWQKSATVLLHFLWQGLAVAFLAGIAVRIWGGRGASIRHGCYVGGLLAMACCPMLTFLWLDWPEMAVLQSEQVETEGNTSYEGAALSSVEGNVVVPADSPPAPILSPVVIQQPLWRSWLLMVWLTGVCCLSGRMLLGYGVLRHWKRQSRPLPADFLNMVQRLSKRLGMSRLPDVAVSQQLSSAMAMGIVRPLILLPTSWLMELPADVLEAVIAHELAHIRRRDLWVNMLARGVETLLFYHPAVWWLTGQLQRERELCCDELAVSVTGRRADYARALEFVARNNVTKRHPVLATGMGGKKMALLDRVRNVLGMGHIDRRTGWWSAGAIALAVPLLFWGVSAAMRPAVADDEERERDRPAAEEREQGEREGRERRDGDREREGDRERDGDRRERGERERDGDRERDGERERDGDRRERGEREREGDRERAERDGNRERPEREASREELLEIIQHLRREVEEMRRHMRGPRGEGDRPREGGPQAERREGDGPPRRGRRDGEGPREGGPRDGDRPREGGPRDDDRPREDDRPRDGDRPREGGPRDGDRPRGEGPREEGRRPDRPQFDGRPATLSPEVLNLIRELRGEVQRLRRDVNELREDRPRPERKPDREEEGERREREEG